MAAALCAECSQIYEGKPGDDTTVVVARIIDRKPVNLMTGPPLDRNDDETITADFMKDESAKHIVSGGTSATILSRELGRPLRYQWITATRIFRRSLLWKASIW